jgi:hypothetical protein
MDREYRNADIQILILIVDRWKATISVVSRHLRETRRGPVHRIAQQFKLKSARPICTHRDRFVAHGELSQQPHRLVQTSPARPILVKQIPSEEDKVDLGLFGNLENLFKRIDSVLPSDRVLFGIANVIVGG